MTGGDCEIQDIQPFMGDLPDSFQQLVWILKQYDDDSSPSIVHRKYL